MLIACTQIMSHFDLRDLILCYLHGAKFFYDALKQVLIQVWRTKLNTNDGLKALVLI